MHVFKIFIMLFFLLVSPYAAAKKEEEVSLPTYTEEKVAIVAEASQPVFILKLKSNPTAGYSWFLMNYDHTLLEPIKHTYEATSNKKLLGAPGYEIWTFHIKPAGFIVPQQTFIRLAYQRPWESRDSGNQIVFKLATR